jgi:hypothetical protein
MNCSNDCQDVPNLSSIIENLLDFEESKLSPTVETLKKSKNFFIIYYIFKLINYCYGTSLYIDIIFLDFKFHLFNLILIKKNYIIPTDLSDHKILASLITMIENLEASTNSNSCCLVLYPALFAAFDLLQKRKFNADIYVKLNMLLNEIENSELFLSANTRLAEASKISNNTVGKTAPPVSYFIEFSKYL